MLLNLTVKFNHFILIICISVGCSAVQVSIGQCPLVIGEACNTGAITFVLYFKNNTFLLDPFKPKFPPNFDLSAPTKVIIHGYSGKLDYATDILIKAYVKQGKVNVIGVDWDQLSQLPCYPTAALNTWQAGQCTAVLMVSLAALGLNPQKLHLLGFSLGAHVASYASNWIYSTMGVKIGRITGLDPALPFFATLDTDWKLDSEDATFVDIIHTNSGIYGKIEASGHADFYVNGGTFQPSCTNHKNPPMCSHMLGPIYFAESITSTRGFWGTLCPGYVQYVLGLCRDHHGNWTAAVMGEHCATRTRGTFFLNTAPNSPYALGKPQKKYN